MSYEEENVDEMKPENKQQSLRERNKARIAQRIILSASELFREPGYEQTTMDAIAERAEVSRGTLFNYFPTKQALLLPFAGQLYTEKVEPEIQAYLNTSPTTLDALRTLFHSIYKHVLALPGVEKALQEELVLNPPHAKYVYYGVGFIDTLSTILQYGQQRQEIRTDIPLSKQTRYLGILYIALLRTVMKQGTAEEYYAEVETLINFLCPALTGLDRQS
jgi:AcrR family transcriptional regulator